jgi:hypothetical protein
MIPGKYRFKLHKPWKNMDLAQFTIYELVQARRDQHFIQAGKTSFIKSLIDSLKFNNIDIVYYMHAKEI